MQYHIACRYKQCVVCALAVLLVAVWMPRGSAQEAASSSPPHELDLLKSCYNHNYTRATLGFVRWLRGAHSRLYLYRGWWSTHAPPSAPLTVFTMASLDRVAQLEAQCRSFAGPHVAAVYLPLRMAAAGAEDDGVKGAQSAVRAAGGKAAAVKKRGLQEEAGRRDDNVGERRESVRGGGGEGGGGGVIAGHEALGWLSEAHQGQIREAERRLQELFDRLEAVAAAAPSLSNTSSELGSCAPHLMLFLELVSDHQLLALMPTNALRNAALLAVRTPLSLMLDADLSLSPHLSALVRGNHPDRLLDLERAAMNRTLCVLAAWGTSDGMPEHEANAMTDAALTGPKAQLAVLWRSDRLHVYAWPRYPKGHGPTNHTHWLGAEEPYHVPFAEGYEPWGVLARLSDPGYDERFRGWMNDKVMHVATLAYLNFSFAVQHDMWAIHRPHKLAVAAAIFRKQDGRAASADLVDAFKQRAYVLHRADRDTAFQHYMHRIDRTLVKAHFDMRTARYVPYQGAQFTQCLEGLPWWRVPGEVLEHEAGRGAAKGWVDPGVGPKDERGVPLPWPPPWRLVRLRQLQQQQQQ